MKKEECANKLFKELLKENEEIDAENEIDAEKYIKILLRENEEAIYGKNDNKEYI